MPNKDGTGPSGTGGGTGRGMGPCGDGAGRPRTADPNRPARRGWRQGIMDRFRRRRNAGGRRRTSGNRKGGLGGGSE